MDLEYTIQTSFAIKAIGVAESVLEGGGCIGIMGSLKLAILSRALSNMAMVRSFMLMARSMMEDSLGARSRAKVSIILRMAIIMMGIGGKVCNKEKGFNILWMDHTFKENGWMIANKKVYFTKIIKEYNKFMKTHN